MTMHTFDDFAQELHEALTHLYDPVYQPPRDFAVILTGSHSLPPGSMQHMVIDAIQRLQPDAQVPSTARSRRLYQLLVCRYVQELTQEETAARLGITPRHLRREQQQAVQMLAQWLWAHRSELKPEDTSLPSSLPASGNEQAEVAWRSQVHQELAALEAADPGVIADVGKVVEQLVLSESGIVARRQARLVAAPAEAGIEVAIHPSVLRQILLVAIQKLAQAPLHGQIELAVVAGTVHVDLTLTAAPFPSGVTVTSEFIAQAVAPCGGEWHVVRSGDALHLQIRLPRVQPVNLLVVDDNADIIHVYRRYLERTRFRVTHAASGQAVFEKPSEK